MLTLSKIWKLTVSALLLIVVAIVAGWWYMHRPVVETSLIPSNLATIQLPQEYLIPNVPYEGQYLGTVLSNQESTGVRTLLDYWDVPNVSNDALLAKFEPTDTEGLRSLGIYTVADFFDSLGFKTEVVPIENITELKFLIANNVPVYVRQRLATDADVRLYSSRIYIGYSDTTNTFTVHDNNFGNNYSISYRDYEEFARSYQQMLIVIPQDYVLSKQPELASATPADYPARLLIMDDPGLRDIQIKLMLVNYLKNLALLKDEDHVADAVALLEEIVHHPAFERLHPAARMSISYNLTGFYMSEAPNLERAAEILETITLPLITEYDFSKPFGGWERRMDPAMFQAPFWNATPWSRLGFIYTRLNEPEKARKAFETALTYVPNYPEAVQGLAALSQ